MIPAHGKQRRLTARWWRVRGNSVLAQSYLRAGTSAGPAVCSVRFACQCFSSDGCFCYRIDTGAEPNPSGIPGGPYEIPLVIQDRQFNRDGTLLFPTSDIPGSVWIGEYFGDVMLVNGKVWPFLEVEPRLYGLRLLNGCSARILNLDIPGTRMWQIGALLYLLRAREQKTAEQGVVFPRPGGP